jgi:hypothetical protein
MIMGDAFMKEAFWRLYVWSKYSSIFANRDTWV